MAQITAIKVESFIPVVRRAGEPPALESWTRWHFQVAQLAGELSQEPVMTRTQWHLKIEWFVRDGDQLKILLAFFEATRAALGMGELYVTHHPVTHLSFE